jgi:hypothetical protein
MKPKRHHLLLVGLLLFFAGVQFRMVQSFTLSERSSHFVAARMGAGGTPQQQAAVALQQQTGMQIPVEHRMVEPPKWLGLALMSIGSVLTLKSLSMRAAGSHAKLPL